MNSNGAHNDRLARDGSKPFQGTTPTPATLIEAATQMRKWRRRRNLHEELARRRNGRKDDCLPTAIATIGGQLALATCQIVLLFSLTLLVQPSQVEPTSNINSVWLLSEQDKQSIASTTPTTTLSTAGAPKQEQQPALETVATLNSKHQPQQRHQQYREQMKLQRANETTTDDKGGNGREQATAESFSQRSGEWRPQKGSQQQQKRHRPAGGDRLPTGPLLAVSSSSLEPSIVELEQPPDASPPPRLDYSQRAGGQRRSDSEPTAANLLGGLLGNSSSSIGDDASSTSVDNLWNLNQTNAQVQFDEEQANQAAGKLGGLGSNQSQQQQQTKRHRVYNEANTTLAPRYTIGGGPPSSLSSSPLSPGQPDSSRPPLLAINATLDSAKTNSIDSSPPLSVSSILEQQHNGNSVPSPLPPMLDSYELSSPANSDDQHGKQDGQAGRDDYRQPTFAPPPSGANRTRPNGSGSHEQQSAYVYYLQDGDKWNSASAADEQLALGDPARPNEGQVELDSRRTQSAPASRAINHNGRRKLHNSGTQYDLREREQGANFGNSMLAGPSLVAIGANSSSSSSPRSAQMAAFVAAAEAMNAVLEADGGGGNSGTARFQAAPSFDQMPAGLQQQTVDRWPARQVAPASETRAAQVAALGGKGDLQGPSLYALQSTSLKHQPEAYPYSPEHLQANSRQQLQLQQHQLMLAEAPLGRARLSSLADARPNSKQKPLTQLPQSSQQDAKRQDGSLLAAGWPRQAQPARSSINRLRPLTSIYLAGDSGANAASNLQRSLLQSVPMLNYIRSQSNFNLQPHSISNSKARRSSLLGSLGSRLNNWVDSGSARGQQQSLESSFYANSGASRAADRAKRRLRAQANNNNKWNGNHGDRNKSNYMLYTPAYYNQHFSGQPADSQLSLTAAGLLRPPLAHYAPLFAALGEPQSGTSALSGAYLSSLHTLRGGGVHQPTVAPAPSSLDRFYARQPPATPAAAAILDSQFFSPNQRRVRRFPPVLAQHQAPDSQLTLNSHPLSHFVGTNKAPPGGTAAGLLGARQQASAAAFIPVVAVSVTKTSPAPRPAPSEEQQSGDQVGGGSDGSEIDEYLELKTSGRAVPRHSNNRLSQDSLQQPVGSQQSALQDDYGTLASSAFRGRRQPAGSQEQQAAAGEHTTTVKSAVFGYLPHQAESPMMQAISMLPQYPGNKAPLAGYNFRQMAAAAASDPSGHSTLDSSSAAAALDSSSQFGHGQQHDGHQLDEPPSLALQLQANNLAQNDIAHPFYDPSLRNKAAALVALQSAAIQQQQTMGPLLGRSPFDSASAAFSPPTPSQYAAFQLLPAATDQIAHQQRQAAVAASLMGNAHLLAAASDLNPLLPGLQMFAPSNDPSVSNNHGHSSRANNQAGADEQSAEGQDPQEFASQSSQLQSQHDQDDADHDGQSTSPTRQQQAGGSQMKSKANKKRSGDFFASAGQLLLSALPLLLAPTLGLMFAASAPNPIARYHGANAFGAGAAANSASAGSSMTGAYMDGLNSAGMVSNASPVPQLFTPTPPGYIAGTTLGGSSDSTTPTAAPTTARPAPTSTQARPPSANRHHQKPPTTTTLTPLSAKRNRYNSSLTSTTIPPAALIKSASSFGALTTLGPPPFVANETDEQTDFDNSSSLVDHLSANTIILMAPNFSSNSSPNSFFNGSESRLSHHFDVSYQGVDFDAQFASLQKTNNSHRAPSASRRKNKPQRQQLSTSYDRNRPVDYQIGNKTSSGAQQQPLPYSAARPMLKEKNQYQYSEVSVESAAPATIVSAQNSTNLAPASSDQQQQRANITSSGFEGEAKLYPVSTWPAMRRRTVSLVTSNGNRTLLDASDRYSTTATTPDDSSGTFNRNKPTLAQQQQPGRFTSNSFAGGDEDDLNRDESSRRVIVRSEPAMLASSSRLQPDEQVEFALSSTEANSNRARSSANSAASSSRRAARALRRRTKRDTSFSSKSKESSSASAPSLAPISLESGRRTERVVRKIKSKQSHAQLKKLDSNDKLAQFADGSNNEALSLPKNKGRSMVRNESSLGSSESSQPRSLSTAESSLGFELQDTSGTSSAGGGRRELLKRALRNEGRAAADIYRDPLKRNASKSQSAHIITTMIAQMNNPGAGDDDDNDSDNDGARNSFSAKSGEISEEVDGNGASLLGDDDHHLQSNEQPHAYSLSAANWQLRNQLLRKKIMLDRLASSSSLVRPPIDEGSLLGQSLAADEVAAAAAAAEEEDIYALGARGLQQRPATSFNRRLISTQAGGGGGGSRMLRDRRPRFPPTTMSDTQLAQAPAPPPIEVTSTKIRLYPNGTEASGRGGRKSGALIITDETKKALANFGSLLIKDTLEIPQQHQVEASRGRVFARHLPRNFGHDKRADEAGDDSHMSSATEHSLTRATPFPHLGGYREPQAAKFTRLRSEGYANRTFPLLEPILPAQDDSPVDPQRHHLPSSERLSIRDRVNLLESESPGYNSFGDSRSADEGGGYSPIQAAPGQPYLGSQGEQDANSGYQGAAPALIDEQSPIMGRYNSSNSRYGGSDNYSTSGPSAYYNQTTHPMGLAADSYHPYSSGQQQGYASHYAHPPARPRQQQQQLAPTHPPYASPAYEAASGAGRDYQPAGYSPSGHERADSHHQDHFQLHYQRQQHFNNHSGGNAYQPLPAYHGAGSHQKAQGANNDYNHQSHQRVHNNHLVSNPDDYGYANPPPTQPPSKYPQPTSYQQQQRQRQESLDFRYSHPSGRTDHQHQHHHQQQQHHQANMNHSYQQPMMAPQPPMPPPPGAEYYTQPKYALANSQRNQPPDLPPPPPQSSSSAFYDGGLGALSAASDKSDSKAVNEYLKRVQFSDSDRDKLMASYLTCDGLLNDNDHCLERLSCEFSDPQNIEKANKLDRAVSSILLGHILINTYIPNQFKLRLKSASLFGYTQSGKCSRYVCNKLTRPPSASSGASFDSAAGAASAA